MRETQCMNTSETTQLSSPATMNRGVPTMKRHNYPVLFRKTSKLHSTTLQLS